MSVDGEPYATRGYGLDVLSADLTQLRLLLDASDARGIELLTPGRPIAMTAGDVRTLESMQMKGRVLRVEEQSPAHRERAGRYCDAFFNDVVEMDRTQRSLIERLRPHDVVAIIVEVDERYNQTPGPGAGAAITDEQ